MGQPLDFLTSSFMKKTNHCISKINTELRTIEVESAYDYKTDIR